MPLIEYLTVQWIYIPDFSKPFGMFWDVNDCCHTSPTIPSVSYIVILFSGCFFIQSLVAFEIFLRGPKTDKSNG